MKEYIVHFIDRQNYVFAREEFLGFTVAEAIFKIGERPVPRYCGAIEIWQHESLVFRGPSHIATAHFSQMMLHR